jgi:hypothetical protein
MKCRHRSGHGRRVSGLSLWAFIAFGAACGSGAKAPEKASGGESSAVEHGEAVSTRQDALVTQTAVTYGYDALGRLAWAEYPASTKRIVYSYDSAGNRSQRAIDTTITNPSPTLPTP